MDIFSIEKPRFFVCGSGRDDAIRYVTLLREKAGTNLRISILRGEKMQNMAGLYDEFAKSFNFPPYFGNNWAALEECLLDLEWLPARAYLTLITEANLLLKSEAQGDTEAFMKMLARITNDWNGGSPTGVYPVRGPIPFHILFHTFLQDADRFRDRLASVIGEPVSSLQI